MQLLLPGYGSPIQDAKSNAMLKIGSSTIKLDSFTDESWEEISNRLINELKQEMMNAELSDDEEFDSATEQPNSDPAFYETTNERYSTKDADQSTTDTKTQLMPNGQTQPADEYEVQEQHMAINDPPTKNFASYLLKNTAGDHTNRSTPSTTDNQTLTKNDFKALGLSNGNEMLKVIEIYDSTGQQRKFDLNVLLQSYAIRPPQDSKSNTTDAGSPYDLIEKVLHNYNVDLEDITKQVLLHNERLLKLKGKHLRNYFRRQLDHTNSSDTTTTSWACVTKSVPMQILMIIVLD